MTEPVVAPPVGAAAVADGLDAARPGILGAYTEGLQVGGSAIAADADALRQALDNAEQILADVSASLRLGRVEIDEKYRLIAWDIGVARAANGIHPRESLQASSHFFGVVLSAAIPLLPPDGSGLELFSLIARVLEQSIAQRVRESVAGYTAILLNQIHHAQVDERRRIARDLHDRIGHHVGVAHRQLELYRMEREPGAASGHPLESRLDTVQQAVQSSLRHLRAVTSDLHAHEPLQSLEQALRHFLDSVDTEQTTVRLRVNGDETWAPPEMLDEVFLILREAAQNGIRHARASMLLINVDITPHELRATVLDDGCGFDPQRPAASGGVGLDSMRERAGLLKGAVAISSSPGRGTQVEITVPLEGRVHDRSA